MKKIIVCKLTYFLKLVDVIYENKLKIIKISLCTKQILVKLAYN